jgi:hypothetical protein
MDKRMGGSKTIKYSGNFERDYNWFLRYKDIFNFDGTDSTADKIIYSDTGASAKDCFYKYDTHGKIIATKEPELLFQIHKCKGSINFNIKAWAEDRGKGCLGRNEFNEIAKYLELLPWMIEAVERQKTQYYKA